MGGYGTWAYLAAAGCRSRAAVPICGGGDPEDAARFQGHAGSGFSTGRSTTRCRSSAAKWYYGRGFKKLGSNVKFTIYPDSDHFSWIPAYKTPELYDWLLEQKRK